MSTSLLYHGFGINGYQYVRTIYPKGKIIFCIIPKAFSLCCPICGSKRVKRRGTKIRMFRTIPIGLKSVFIQIPIQRVECLCCNVIRQVKIKFAEWRRSYTKAFERYALALSKHMTILDVANHLGVSWDTIKDIQKRYLAKKYKRPRLKNITRIAIDEISIGKGHRYLTVVLDLKTGAVIFVGDGRGVDSLRPFFKRLKYSKAEIKAVAIDMSPSYIAAVLENLPDSTIVFDHFHVIKLLNDKLSELRRAIHREAEGPLQKKVLKGTRWLLLKNSYNLNEQKNEKERLEEALSLNKPLATAYYLKEDLRQVWSQVCKSDAKTVLTNWIKKAQSTGIAILQKFANTLAGHAFGILNYYDYPISTGPLEGTNNKIKTLQKQAYGYRDMDFFKLKIYGLHEAKYALVG
jgi:transposase